MATKIKIRGASTHNLQRVDVEMPRDQFVLITGLSGSGKSSLAFDTIYAEGQRRYVESLSTYARQFLSMMDKPEVDLIEGLSPAIAIEQKSVSHNPRSTVGTVTEIYDYLRLLYARLGVPHCPQHGTPLQAQTRAQMVDAVLARPEGQAIYVLAPVVRNRKGTHTQLLDDLQRQGFVRVRLNGEVMLLSDVPPLPQHKKHTLDVVVDRLKVRPDIALRVSESFETALNLADGLASVVDMDSAGANEQLFSSRFACPTCGYAIAELAPRLFSFNSPVGACSQCDGLGVEQRFDPDQVVVDANLSCASGAIRGWDRSNRYYYALLQSLAEYYEFDIEQPFCDLPVRIQEKILYGTGRQKIRLKYVSTQGRTWVRNQAFEGVLPNMERRYRETDSDAVRTELAKYRSVSPCGKCEGSRLNEGARHVTVGGETLHTVTQWSVDQVLAFFKQCTWQGQQVDIAQPIMREITERLQFLVDVGLNYLTLQRSADTLSGGEGQRIRLASQIGSGLVGVMYVLDEPSIGLHARDNQRLLNSLFHLRDLGNTVIVVEHDEDAIRQADYIIDMGPGAGTAGGRVVATGTVSDILAQPASLTGQYLSGALSIPVPAQRVPYDPKRVVRIQGASCHNLKDVDIDIPVGLMTCVTGVSGSGKSSLINQTLYPAAARVLNGAVLQKAAPHTALTGLGFFDKVVAINQAPIGRTPRSNPATYGGLFGPIRELFAATQEARSRGYTPGRFSFNVKGGRCEACQGDGLIKVEMHFLANVYVHCDTCQGTRYHRETLEIRYKSRTIHEVLSMTVAEALDFFKPVPVLARKLQTLMDVGLGYVQLGQSATTLSGGEAQRLKLAKELSKRATGNTLYILDEPTTGLHFHDVKQLLTVLHRLRDQGNTVVVIEHHLDVIKTADWLIDMGPEGGQAGGTLVAKGTPEAVAKVKASHTGRFLAPLLAVADVSAVTA